MDFLISTAHAQAAGAAPANPLITLLPLVLMFVVFYFLLIRPQMKRQKEHRTLIENLSKGDEVVTNGGVLGRIDELGDTYLSVEVAPGTRIKVQRQAISQVVPKGTIKNL
jgi:preprotein translocase subunit YajC